jgi:glutamate/tyrosine decarboxylase-like PLP-dependent enzyme
MAVVASMRMGIRSPRERHVRDLLNQVAGLAADHLESVGDRPAGATASFEELRAALASPLAADGVAPAQVIEELAAAVSPGLVGSAGPRYFGFVTGGSLPAALGADWLASTWDQNSFSAVSSPAASVVEEVACGWLLDLLGLPADAGAGLTTGAQMANVTALAAARHSLLRAAGWDVEERGLAGSPPLRVFAGEEAHVTIWRALRLLGIGRAQVEVVPADAQGAMRSDALALDGPALVCAQAGNVNSGAFDPVADLVAAAREHGAWVHVDGAFGLWAAASPVLAHLTDGVADADSWATDGHKWLNVPYDCGVVAVRDAEAHAQAMGMQAAYLVRDASARSNSDWVPEASRRGRGFAVYAALRSLGRDGVVELIDRCCALARRLAEAVGDEIEVLNDVILNQVLLAIDTDVIAELQAEGTFWAGGTVWHGRPALRFSVSSWATTEADIDRCAEVMLRAVRQARR